MLLYPPDLIKGDIMAIDYAAQASGFASNFINGLYYALIVLIVCVILGIFVYRLTFKCKLRIRYLTDTFDKIKDVPCKLAIDKRDGMQKLIVLVKLFKKKRLPAPPPEAVSLNFKGRDCFEVEWPSDGEPRYIVKSKTERKYKPFDSNDRIFYLNEHEKIIKRSTKGIHDLLAMAMPYIFLLILSIAIIAFWGDIVEPFNKAGETNLAIMQENAKITGMLKEIIKQEQLVTGEVEVIKPSVNATPPD